MSGLCILTFTILTHIISGLVCQVESATAGSSGPGQYADDHRLRRLPSDPSSSETLRKPRKMFHTLIRDVGTLLNNFNYGLLDNTRQKYKRSPQSRPSLDDSRMLKQLWDAYNRHKSSNQVAEDRYFFFPNFDAWSSSFTMYFFRDMAFNVFKIVGLSALYYLAPGVLAWYTETFGST